MLSRQTLANVRSSELIDSVASSRLGRLASPLTLLVTRNGRADLAYENTRMLALAFAYVRSEQIAGDYAEFGVYQGRTFVEAWRMGRKYPAGRRRFFAFDSFEGLPAPDSADDTGRFSLGDFSSGRAAFESRLRRARIPAPDVHLVEGFFSDTLATPELIPLEQVAVAWIDCDLYTSTVPVLEYLTPRLTQGAIVVFDDWYCFQGASDKGEAKACAEWLERNPDIRLVPWQQHNWAGQSFIFRREPDGAGAESGER